MNQSTNSHCSGIGFKGHMNSIHARVQAQIDQPLDQDMADQRRGFFR